MAELTAEQIAQRALDLDLLTDQQLQEIWGDFGRRNVPADEFVQFLLRREFMTNFQLDRMLKGERTGYFYGDYKVLYMVAGGTFARVYRAMQKSSGEVRALKVLRKRYSDDPAQTDHFCREGRVGINLRHPNIVPIEEVYSKGRTHFFVMEFIEGRNLREFLKVRKKLEPAEATRLMIDMANGLKYAADHGVTHRDLKLSNILVSSHGQVKLVDFGLAATDSNLADEKIGESIGARTIDYVGLERATGVRKDDRRSDLYFMGCIYYHMLMGHSPLQETRDRIQRLSKTRYVNVEPIRHADPTMPRVVAGIVDHAMDLNADRRYQNPGEMLSDLNVAADRLAKGELDADLPGSRGESHLGGVGAEEVERAAALATVETDRPSLMFVESNSRLQDKFRESLKKAGFRVLLTSDPAYALKRFKGDKKPASCIVFSTSHLGESAVNAFNDFATSTETSHIPAVLLWNPGDDHWAAMVQSNLAEHRLLVPMPIKLREFQEAVTRLIKVPTEG